MGDDNDIIIGIVIMWICFNVAAKDSVPSWIIVVAVVMALVVAVVAVLLVIVLITCCKKCGLIFMLVCNFVLYLHHLYQLTKYL